MSSELLIDAGLQRLIDRLHMPDLRPLMAQVEALMTEDHTRAQLAGQDKDGNPYKRVTYRSGMPVVQRKRNRNNRGVGPALEDAHGNLSSSEYRKLTGPPLTPRGMRSRIIANHATSSGKSGNDWYADSFLVGIVDAKGNPFMHHHFEGNGRNPRRDARGIRPQGRAAIRSAIRLHVTVLLSGVRA